KIARAIAVSQYALHERRVTLHRRNKPLAMCPEHIIEYWLPDQGFYEDCQVLLSQLSEWPNNWWSAGRVFPSSLLCAKGYPFHVRAGGASPAPTSTLLDDLFSYRSIKRKRLVKSSCSAEFG